MEAGLRSIGATWRIALGAGGVQGRPALRVQDPEDRVASVMSRHGRTLLRTANHWSICHDDALDAYQRALEIFLRRADSVQPETEVAWLKVVICRMLGTPWIGSVPCGSTVTSAYRRFVAATARASSVPPSSVSESPLGLPRTATN